MPETNQSAIVTPEVVASAEHKLHMQSHLTSLGIAGPQEVWSFTPEERIAVDQMKQFNDAIAETTESEGI